MIASVSSTRRSGSRGVSEQGKPIVSPAMRVSAGDPANVRASCTRLVTPSLRKTLCRWYSTVLALMNSRPAISRLDRRSAASRAICASCAVSTSGVPRLRGRARSPVARSSARARPAKAVMPISSNISKARRSWSRASRRRRWRRSHSPYTWCARASSGTSLQRCRWSMASRYSASAWSSSASSARLRASRPRARSVPLASAQGVKASRAAVAVSRSPHLVPASTTSANGASPSTFSRGRASSAWRSAAA